MKGIYIIKGDKKNLYKIGCSSNIERRIQQLKYKYPHIKRGKLIYSFDTNYKYVVEKYIHEIYKDNRVADNLELFNIKDIDLDYIHDKCVEINSFCEFTKNTLLRYFGNKYEYHIMYDIERFLCIQRIEYDKDSLIQKYIEYVSYELVYSNEIIDLTEYWDDIDIKFKKYSCLNSIKIK